MKIKDYFEYEKDSLSTQKSEFLNILNKIEQTIPVQQKRHESRFTNFRHNLISLKYFISGVTVASFVYFVMFYNNTISKQSLVITDNDIKVEYLENAINSIDITVDAFSNK
jgi:hypothetical protein